MSASPARGACIDALAALALLVLAYGLRTSVLPHMALTSDSIGPYLKAWSITHGAGLLPSPHAPESGPGLYWLTLPLVLGADSLEDLFRRRALAQALLAPLLYLAVARFLRPRLGPAPAWLGGLVAGLTVACSGGLPALGLWP